MNAYSQFSLSFQGFEKDIQFELDSIIDSHTKTFEIFLASSGFGSDKNVSKLNFQILRVNGNYNVNYKKREAADTRILCVSDFENFETVLESIKTGYTGCVSYLNVFTDIVPAITSALQNKIYISPSFFPVFDHHSGLKQADAGIYKKLFTRREYKLIQFLTTGALYKEIAYKLDISENTVRAHIRNIYGKLKVHSKTELTQKILSGKIFGSIACFFTDYIACLCY